MAQGSGRGAEAPPEQVLLGLGTNLGDREANLQEAIARLRNAEGIRVRRVSSVYETEPVGPADQPPYLNMAAEIETDHSPLELLDQLKAIEKAMGRTAGEKWGPRLIDIDIVLWGSRVIDDDDLVAPHKEFRNRAFVLEPLAEIAPEAVDPVTGLTVRELAARPEAMGRVERHSLDH